MAGRGSGRGGGREGGRRNLKGDERRWLWAVVNEEMEGNFGKLRKKGRE